MTDLGWLCQQNNTKIHRSTNLPQKKRCKSLESIWSTCALSDRMESSTRPWCRKQELLRPLPFSAHKDALLLWLCTAGHYPSNPCSQNRVFLGPRKCGTLGGMLWGYSSTGEPPHWWGMSSSNGFNMLIGLLRHFFDNYSMGDMEAGLHCDNCSRQNKNRYMLLYLA